MKRTIEMLLMLLTIVLVAMFMGTSLAACSSDEDEPETFTYLTDNGPIGYWLDSQCDEEDLMHQQGLAFRADSTIYLWSVTPERWGEQYWGRLGRVTGDGSWELEIPITDNEFRIKSLSASRLVIEHLNGWTMQRTNQEYKKMRFGPVYIN